MHATDISDGWEFLAVDGGLTGTATHEDSGASPLEQAMARLASTTTGAPLAALLASGRVRVRVLSFRVMCEVFHNPVAVYMPLPRPLRGRVYVSDDLLPEVLAVALAHEAAHVRDMPYWSHAWRSWLAVGRGLLVSARRRQRPRAGVRAELAAYMAQLEVPAVLAEARVAHELGFTSGMLGGACAGLHPEGGLRTEREILDLASARIRAHEDRLVGPATLIARAIRCRARTRRRHYPSATSAMSDFLLAPDDAR